MDRFNEFNAFIAVAETGGFSAAARRTDDSQSAISKAIGALERRLGAVLFNRNTRSVTLTDQGKRYYDRAKTAAWDVGRNGSAEQRTVSVLNVSDAAEIAAINHQIRKRCSSTV